MSTSTAYDTCSGLFFARGCGRIEGQGANACAYDTMKISHARTARVCDFALQLARRRKAQGGSGRVTSVDKASVFASMALWRQVFEERARAFPDVDTEHAYVDAMALSPAHGTAPDIAGRGIANPSAMLLSAAMMLDQHLLAPHARFVRHPGGRAGVALALP